MVNNDRGKDNRDMVYENQRTIGPVNAHLISGSSFHGNKSTSSGEEVFSRNDLDLPYLH